MNGSGLRDLMAMNLRRLCAGEPSIASVCRALGINRQQFNNYLSARNLPNETVVRKVCEFFKVEPYELFLPADHAPREPERNGPVRKFVDEIVSASDAGGALPEVGSYFVYFEAAFDPSALMRSYMEISDALGFLTFSRITKIPINEARARRTTLWSRHDGLVRSEGQHVHWSGYNIRATARPSLLIGRALRTPPILYAGVGLIDTGNGMEQAGFAVTRAPTRSLAVMRSLGPVRASDTPATRVALRAIEGYRRSFSASYSIAQ